MWMDQRACMSGRLPCSLLQPFWPSTAACGLQQQPCSCFRPAHTSTSLPQLSSPRHWNVSQQWLSSTYHTTSSSVHAAKVRKRAPQHKPFQAWVQTLLSDMPRSDQLPETGVCVRLVDNVPEKLSGSGKSLGLHTV